MASPPTHPSVIGATGDEADTLFSLQGLGLSYRAKPVLRAIDWTWQRGQHWAILGPNGAGKTTLASVLAGEQSHYVGDLIKSPRLRDGGVAYVCFERGRRLCERDAKLDCAEYESDAIDTGTRVRDLLPEGLNDIDRKYRQSLIDLLALEPLLDRGLRYVSTGELRKTLLASALLLRPELLILDSPMDGLDIATQRRLTGVLSTIMQQHPAVLLLCRDPDEIHAQCTHLMLMQNGRIVDRGERDALLHSDSLARLMQPPALHYAPPPIRYGATDRDSEETGSAPAILLRDVTVRYGELCVFRDLSWRLDAHQHCMIIGPNGSGKSTLLDLLTGDNHKAYGQDVTLFGRRRGTGESVWDIKARFGRVDARMQFQVPNGSRVLGVVLSGFFDSLGLRERPSDQQRARGLCWLEALGLSDLREQEFHTLSFGLQRLVLLARAMVKDPRILLLDEATLSLDAAHRALLLGAIDHVAAESRCQVLFVSHAQGERPRCINQTLTFHPASGGSTVVVENLE